MKRIYWIIIIALLGCNQHNPKPVMLEGKTMGTTYHVTFVPADEQYSSADGEVVHFAIDSLLIAFNNSVSTYIPTSTISKVNGTDTLITTDEYFMAVFNRANQVSEITNGAFDVTVMPLVNAWGFGFTDTMSVDSVTIDSLLQFVGYKKVSGAGTNTVTKRDRRTKVDFSAIAKGYGVDLIGMLLEKNGITNYMVEIGGEVRTKGLNGKNSPWVIGIEKPIEGPSGHSQELENTIKMMNKSLATSGNYRNYYIRDGKKVSHIINPSTGFPSLNNLLSATVIAEDCMTADAFATAFMVMGFEKSKEFISNNKDLSAFLIYSDGNGKYKTWHSSDLDTLLVEKE